jgi:hypothetical protein
LALVVAALAPFIVGAFVAGLEKRVQRRTLRVLADAQIPLPEAAVPARGRKRKGRSAAGDSEHADEG